MNFLVAVLVVTTVSFASNTLHGGSCGLANYALPETDYNHDSYAYDANEVFTTTIPASFGDYVVVDDFRRIYSEPIYYYTCWGVTTASVPYQLELILFEDSNGPDGPPISQNLYNCTIISSGFSYASYPVWVAIIHIPYGLDLAYNETVWLGSHRNDGNNWYPACGTTVSGSEAYRTLAAGWYFEPLSNTLQYGDLFKIISDSPPSGVALERNTWAGIKTAF